MSTTVTVKLTAAQFDAIRAVIARDREAATRMDTGSLTADEKRALLKRGFELDALERVFS